MCAEQQGRTDRGSAEVRELAARICAERRAFLARVANRHAPGPADAEDALQESLISFIAKFDPAGGAEPLPWLVVTLKRECWARSRARGRAVQEASADADEIGFVVEALEDTHPSSSPERMAELGELVAETRGLLDQLKPQEREVICLKALGYSYAEIGELTGYTYTKVNRCMAEGAERLRTLGAPVRRQGG
jgi:RNA polymerase sigma factor (sigma-70 family)